LKAVALSARMPQRNRRTASLGFGHFSRQCSSPRAQRHESGSCTLADGSALVWVLTQEESCKFVSIAKMKGHLLGDVWISDAKQFALSWSDNSPRIQDCGADLVMSDQGYALMTTSRVPPAATPQVGVVTTNQLAAQLLAVEGSHRQFLHAHSALCDRTNLLALTLHNALETHPTLALRHLLNRVDLAASYLGSDVVQIHRCITVPAQNYRLVPFNGSCFSKPLVKLTLAIGAAFHSFIDPVTRIVSPAASPIDCSAVPFFFFSIPGGYIKFEPSQGASVRVAGSSLHAIDLPDSFNSSTFTLPLTIFHNLVLINLSELVQDHQWQELWSSVDQERLSQFHAHLSTPAADSHHPASSFSFWSFLLGSWSWFDLWVSICCVVISLGILRAVIAVYCSMYFPGGLPSPTDLILSSRRSLAPSSPGSPPPSAITAPQPSSREDLDRRQMEDLTLQLTRLEIDSTSTWPPRVFVTPVKVLALMNHKQFFMAQIPIKVNNIHVLALIDTGASITVTTVETAPLFGVFTFSAGSINTAIGMAGIPIRILGCATLHFEFGSVAIDHPVYFTEAACVSSSADSYNIILGNDLLAKLLPWSINYANRTLSMAELFDMQILCVAPPTNECSSEEPIAVRVLETTVLPPSAETFVRCRADIEDQHTLMLTAQADSLGERSLMVTPAVFNSISTLLLVVNPSSRPETLYKGQHISSAVKIFESSSGTLSTNESCS
uniref:Peptidase A2 domain-containing protein n=1 Tax=Heligmosomoides polygyrus TaxID=6339 RepID=A0A183F9F6_HELPZ